MNNTNRVFNIFVVTWPQFKSLGVYSIIEISCTLIGIIFITHLYNDGSECPVSFRHVVVSFINCNQGLFLKFLILFRT